MPWLSLLILIPLVGAIVVGSLRNLNDTSVRRLGLAVAVIELAVFIATLLQFKAGAADPIQLVERYDWIPAFGISFALGVDGIALVLIGLGSILVPVVMLAGWNESEGHRGSVRQYVVLTLIAQAFMVGVFAAIDVFLFYVFFEAILIPMYFLIGRFGGPRGTYAAVKFLLYSLVGGLLMLAALVGLWFAGIAALGRPTFDWATLTSIPMDAGTERWLFLGFFIAFAVKAPLVPFHTWLPDAAGEATPGSATLLVGVMDKIGTFGMLRYLLPLFPFASREFAPLVIALSLVGIVYGALLAIGQSDIKRLIAYTSVSHFGFISLGIFAFTTTAQSGSAFYMVNHGFSTAALFLTAGFLISRRGSKFIEDFGGVNKVAPVLAGTFLLSGLSSLALPGMSSFVSELMVLVGTFARHPWVALIAVLGIVLSALYILLMYQRTMTGEPTADVAAKVSELTLRERLAIAPVIALIVLLGFFPQIVLDIVNPSVARILSTVQMNDPAPVGLDATKLGVQP